MRIEEYLHAAMVNKGRSGVVPVIECDGQGDAQTPPGPTDPAKGDQ